MRRSHPHKPLILLLFPRYGCTAYVRSLGARHSASVSAAL
jgi:hypothetical protein